MNFYKLRIQKGFVDWITYIKTDENQALRDIYQKYRGGCLAWISKEWNLSREDAKEIFQVSVVILYDNVVTGRLSTLSSDLKSYLFSIARNKARELLRKRTRINGAQGPEILASYIQLEVGEKQLLEAQITRANQALQEMGDPCKTLLQLFYYKQMTMDDICQLMGYKNRDTVKNQKYKCLKRLQKLFHHHINTDPQVESKR